MFPENFFEMKNLLNVTLAELVRRKCCFLYNEYNDRPIKSQQSDLKTQTSKEITSANIQVYRSTHNTLPYSTELILTSRETSICLAVQLLLDQQFMTFNLLIDFTGIFGSIGEEAALQLCWKWWHYLI